MHPDERDQRLYEELHHIKNCLCDIAHTLRHHFRIPQSATLMLKGDLAMPATIQVGGSATATYLEWSGPSGTGVQVPPTGTVSYSSDTPGVATVDPNTGICSGVGPGTTNISGTDSGTGLSASDVLTVQAAPPPPAVSATLTLVANSSVAMRRG